MDMEPSGSPGIVCYPDVADAELKACGLLLEVEDLLVWVLFHVALFQ
jgi:hypothetical protein